MPRVRSTYDVFIAHTRRDMDTAMEVADVMRSYELNAFVDTAEIDEGSKLEETIWEAMAESIALVAIIPQDVTSAWMAFELGAAKAWNKPVYALASQGSFHDLPISLRDVTIYPLSRAYEVALSIKRSAEPISSEDEKHLITAYEEIGVAADQLALQPKHLAKLVTLFHRRTGRQMSGEQLMSLLLRLRKRGRLHRRKGRPAKQPNKSLNRSGDSADD